MEKMVTYILAGVMVFAGSVSACTNKEETASSSSYSTATETYDLTLLEYIYYLEDEESKPLKFTFKINGETGSTSKLTFSSDNTSIVTVNSQGEITGIGGGKATITVSIGEINVKATVFVTMRTKRVTLSERTALLFVGETRKMIATAYNGENQDENAILAWKTEDESVATVVNGTITAVGVGRTFVTVSYGEQTAKVLVTVALGTTAENVNTFSEEYINIFGRNYIKNGVLNLDYVASGVEVGFVGNSFTVNLDSPSDLYLRVYIDDDEVGERIAVNSTKTQYVLVDNLAVGQHKIRIINTSERSLKIASFVAEKFWVVPEKSDLKIEFIGDSITAGYGVLGNLNEGWSLLNSDGSNTYAYNAVKALNADYSVIASSGICVTNVNATFRKNMETMYAEAVAKDGGFMPDVVVLNLGTNDAMRDPEFGTNYQKFLMMLRNRYQNAYIICLYGMMGFSNNIVNGIEQSLNNLSDPKIVYNPFTITENAQGADGHPIASAQKAWGLSLADYIKILENEYIKKL